MTINKTAVPYKKTPVSSKESWDSSVAIKGVKEWATKENGEMDWGKYRKAFAWYDASEPEKQGSYKLPHHEVVDGTLKVNKQGVVAAYSAMRGARGGVNMPQEDRKKVMNHIMKHYDDCGMERPEEMMKTQVMKAEQLTNYNKYIWIKTGTEKFLLTDSDVVLQLQDKSAGVAYYYKTEPKNIVIWRFIKSKGWTEETANQYVLAAYSMLGKSQAMELVKNLNEFDGENYMTKSQREAVHEFVSKNVEFNLPGLVKQKEYEMATDTKEKMKKLAELSNMEFHSFIDEAQKERLQIVRNADKFKADEQKGFKFHAQLQAYKIVEKDENGKNQERWMLKATFTSNKADLHWDVTSKAAIEKAVADLQGKVIPIRFEHQSEDYGYWETFKTYEKDGILYGLAEGELDSSLSRSKDLWKEIFEYGKEFAVSYGGEWMQMHYEKTDEDGEDYDILRIFDEIVIKEISLTTRPANPDTTLEALNKYAGRLERHLDLQELSKFTDLKAMKKNADQDKEKLTPEATDNKETEEKKPETAGEPTVEPKEEKQPEADPKAKPDSEKEEEADKEKPETDAKPEEKKEEKSATELLHGILKEMKELVKQNTELAKRVAALEEKPEKPTPVLNNKEEKSDQGDESEQKKNFPFMTSIAKALEEKGIIQG